MYYVARHHRHEKENKRGRFALLLSISDASTVLSIAYVWSFVAKAKCTMSIYHYYISLDSILIACSTMVVVFVISGLHYWETGAGILRFLIALMLFILLGIFFGYQKNKYSNDPFPDWRAPNIKVTNESAILLPASCFLDPDLIQHDNPYVPGLLSSAQLDRVGRPVKGNWLPQFWLYVILCVALAMGIAAHFREYFRRQQEPLSPNSQAESLGITIGKRLFWSLIFGACFVTDIICVFQIATLRKWANASGWMSDNAENDENSLGQLLPVCSSLLIFVAFLDKCKIGGKEQENAHRDGYIDYDPMGQSGTFGVADAKEHATVHVTPLDHSGYV